MLTAEKNRKSRARGKVLKDIESHVEYLDKRVEQIDEEGELMVVALIFVRHFIWVLL